MHPAASAALAAISRCGGSRSGRFSAVEASAPTTNPSCTEAVNHTAAVELTAHSPRSAGTTADAENHTDRPSTWTSAISARWTAALCTQPVCPVMPRRCQQVLWRQWCATYRTGSGSLASRRTPTANRSIEASALTTSSLCTSNGIE